MRRERFSIQHLTGVNSSTVVYRKKIVIVIGIIARDEIKLSAYTTQTNTAFPVKDHAVEECHDHSQNVYEKFFHSEAASTKGKSWRRKPRRGKNCERASRRVFNLMIYFVLSSGKSGWKEKNGERRDFFSSFYESRGSFMNSIPTHRSRFTRLVESFSLAFSFFFYEVREALQGFL